MRTLILSRWPLTSGSGLIVCASPSERSEASRLNPQCCVRLMGVTACSSSADMSTERRSSTGGRVAHLFACGQLGAVDEENAAESDRGRVMSRRRRRVQKADKHLRTRWASVVRRRRDGRGYLAADGAGEAGLAVFGRKREELRGGDRGDRRLLGGGEERARGWVEDLPSVISGTGARIASGTGSTPVRNGRRADVPRKPACPTARSQGPSGGRQPGWPRDCWPRC
jgi:hypothetical protein